MIKKKFNLVNNITITTQEELLQEKDNCTNTAQCYLKKDR